MIHGLQSGQIRINYYTVLWSYGLRATQIDETIYGLIPYGLPPFRSAQYAHCIYAHKISKFPATWCARAAVGRRKTALGAPHSPEIGHTMYAVILHHLCHNIILFITCARTCWIALNWHSIYAVTNRAHPPKNVGRGRRPPCARMGASSVWSNPLHPTLPTFFTNLNSSNERNWINCIYPKNNLNVIKLQ